MRMTHRLLATTAAAAALVIVAPVAAAWAATTPHVLTTRKTGGTNVAVNAVLKAGLETGKPFTLAFSYPSFSVTIEITCTKSTFTTKVTADPARPGTASLSLTSLTVPAADCTADLTGISGVTISVQSVKFGVPHKTTISDAVGDPVTVTSPKVTLAVTAPVVGAVTCIFSAAKMTGAASNTGSVIAFTNQPIDTVASGSDGTCNGATASISASYGPLADTSATGNPHVFVN